MLNTTRSEELYKVALDLMPGGVNSPVRAFGAVGRNPLFIDHAKGSYVYDVDGNKFIDYVCSWGPGILGHSHPEVLEEVVKACFDGLTFGAPTGKENQLAQLVKDCVPSMEMMRMVSSGTEATMSAIRAARGFTGRDKIIKFKGCYHGHSDGLLVQAGSAALTQSVPDSSGVPASFAQQTLVALYNDKDSVRELFENNKDQIAALIVEPVAANMGVVIPDDDFLPFLREITAENGTILIFDEVITGFRLGVGGAQEWFGINPDLSTFGKIVGGGMPMAVYGGLQDQELLKIVANTLIVSVVSTILSTIIGTMAAYGITRYKFKGKSVLMNILYIPIVIPEIVMGVSLLMIFMLLNFPLGLVSMILAHVTFSAPFVVITVRGRIGDMGVVEEEASMDLGANRRTTFFRVTLPMMMPAIISGAFMAFTLSFDDLVVSTFVAGANSTTLPIKVQSMMKTGVTPEINALSTVIFVILLTLCLLGKLAGWLIKKRSDKLEAEALAALVVPGDAE